MPGAPRRGWPGRAGPCPSPSHRRSRRGEAGVSSTGGREAARPESARLPVWGSHLLVRLARPRCTHSTPLRAPLVNFHHQRAPGQPSVLTGRFPGLPSLALQLPCRRAGRWRLGYSKESRRRTAGGGGWSGLRLPGGRDMKILGRILRLHRFSLADLLLFVFLGLDMTQPVEFSAAATSQPAGLNSPSNTNAVAVSDSRIDVSWQDNSANETGFEVHRSADGSNGAFTLVATTAAGVTARGDLGLNPSTQYCYKVRAFKRADGRTRDSDFSNTACATTLAPPPPPPGLHVTAATTGVDLDADGYSVDVWKDSGGSRIHVTSTGLPANGTVTISGLDPAAYQVELSGVAVNCDLASPNPQAVTLGSSDAAVQFDVTCALVTQLAFASTVDGNPEIYVINSNGTGSTRLTFSDPASDAEPAWSPDGTKIAFRSDRSGSPEIYVINADGSNPVRLTDAAGGNFHPAWSPDGTKVAFTSKRDGNGEIYVMNADGTGLVNLTNHGADDGDPAWSPDGTKIAFTSDRDGNAEIYVMNADGSGVARLTSDPSAASAAPEWSPDGSKIAFSRRWSSSGSCFEGIFVMNVDGSGVNQVTCCEAHGPVWSPDGRKIAFTANASVSPVIAVIRADGTDLVELTSGSDPAWRRGGAVSGCIECGDGCPIGAICNGGGCCVPHCFDGSWGGEEGGTDCGGACLAKCQSGQHCWVGYDCASGSCVNDVCQ